MTNFGKHLNSLSPEKQLYSLQAFPIHLTNAEQGNRLRQLLTNFDFIQAKTDRLGPQALIADYDLAFPSGSPTSEEVAEMTENSLKLIQGALRLSAHVVVQDKTQLIGQLVGRLLAYNTIDIQRLLNQAKQQAVLPWLNPMTSLLTSPDSPLLYRNIIHDARINSVVIMPNGQQAISGSSDKTIKVWNLENGAVLFTLPSQSEVNAVVITPDGKRIISGLSDGTIRVWDVENKQELLTLSGHTDSVNTLAITSDGKQVISGSSDMTVGVWDLERGQEQLSLTGHIGYVHGVAVTPDGSRALSAGGTKYGRYLTGNCLITWDLKKGTILHSNAGVSFSVAITPDGRLGISAGHSATTPYPIMVWVWDLEKGTKLHALDYRGAVNVTPDGKQGVCVSNTGSIIIWDLLSGTILFSLMRNTDPVSSIAISHDGKRMVAASGTVLEIWDLENMKQQSSQTRTHAVSQIIVTSNGHYAIALNDNNIEVWNIKNRKKTHSFDNAAPSYVSLTPDGKQILWNTIRGNVVMIGDLETGRKRLLMESPPGDYWSSPYIKITPDGQLAIITWLPRSGIGQGYVIGVESGEQLMSLGGINGASITLDSSRVVGISNDDTLVAWDLTKCDRLQELRNGTEKIDAFTLTPDGYFIISVSRDPWDSFSDSNHSILTVWDMEKGTLIRQSILHTNSESVRKLEMTPDGKRLIIHTYEQLIVWDLEIEATLYTLPYNTDGSSIVISSDGQFAMLVGENRPEWDAEKQMEVLVWDVERGTALFRFRAQSLSAHLKNPLSHRIVLRNPQILFALDKKLSLYNLESSKLTSSFTTDVSLSCCTVTPDGLSVVVGDELGQVHFLRLEGA